MSIKRRRQEIHKLRFFQFYVMIALRVLLKGIIIFLPFITTAFLIYSVHTGNISTLDSLCQISSS